MPLTKRLPVEKNLLGCDTRLCRTATPLRSGTLEPSTFVKTASVRTEATADAWVRLKLGPVLLWFPNTRGRVRAVRLHDLHHIATGYTTTPVGEAEIGAWELASGCGDYLAAWVLNLGAVPIGAASPARLIAPARASQELPG